MSNCVQDFQKTGVGLLGDTLSGDFSFVFDTANSDSFIKKISYETNDYDVNVSHLSAYFQISNYQCDFQFENSILMTENPYYVSALNLSGRYVKMFFDIGRDDNSSLSPRVYDVDVDFAYTKKEYDYKTTHKFKSDIYGFEYALLKEDLDLDLYNYKTVDGEILVKTLDRKIETLDSILPSAYKNYKIYPNLYSEMLTGIQDLELFFDTLMFVTSNYVIYEKINYNFESEVLSINPTNTHILTLSSLSSTYSDVWFFESDNYFLTFLGQEQQISSPPSKVLFPKVYRSELSNDTFTEVEVENLELLNGLTSVDVSRFEIPVVTFDAYRNMFNMGTMAYYDKGAAEDFNIISINMEYYDETLHIKDYNVISSVDF